MTSTALAILPVATTEIDWMSNHPATDVLWFNTHFSPIVPLPAVESNSPAGFKVGFVKGSTITLRIQVYNPNSVHTVSTTVALLDPHFVHSFDSSKNVSLSGGGTQNITLAPKEKRDVYFPLTGFPDKVTTGWITAHVTIPEGPWWAEFPDDTPPAYAIGKVFLTYATPTQHQSVVWNEMMESSCAWGDWSNTAFGTCQSVIDGLYFAPGLFQYAAYRSPRFLIYDPGGQNHAKFLLTDMFSGAVPTTVDCRDISSFLALLFQSQGISCNCEVHWTGSHFDNQDPPVIIGFLSNPLKGIGLTSFYQYSFNFHQVCETALDGATQYWDAAAGYERDLSGAPYALPPHGWAMPDFFQKQISSSLIVGLANGFNGIPQSLTPHDNEDGAPVGIYQFPAWPDLDNTPVPNGVR